MRNTFDTTGDSMQRRIGALLLVIGLAVLGASTACTSAGPDPSVVAERKRIVDERQAIEDAVNKYVDLLIEGEVVTAQERDTALGRYSTLDVTHGFVETVTVEEPQSGQATWRAKAIMFVTNDGGINHSFAVNFSGTTRSSGQQIAIETAFADPGSQ